MLCDTRWCIDDAGRRHVRENTGGVVDQFARLHAELESAALPPAHEHAYLKEVVAAKNELIPGCIRPGNIGPSPDRPRDWLRRKGHVPPTNRCTRHAATVAQKKSGRRRVAKVSRGALQGDRGRSLP